MWAHEPGGGGQPAAPAERVSGNRNAILEEFFSCFHDPVVCDSGKSKDMVELLKNLRYIFKI